MSSKNLKIFSCLLFIALCLGLGYAINLQLQNIQTAEIKPSELEQLLIQQPQAITLIDVRTADEYNLEHIPTAILIPLAELESNMPRIKNLASNRRVITYCASGKRSYKALRILKQHQIEGANLTGGFDAWWKFKQP